MFNAEGNVVDFRTFMVPRSDYTIEDVWNVVGLRGTGSNDIIVEDVFVPEAFTLSMSDTGRCFGPGQEVNTSDLYKLPFHSVFTMTISTPLIGMAYGAYSEHVEMQRKRVRAAYLAEKTANDPYASVRIARASNEIDAAWVLQIHNLRELQALRRARREDPAGGRLRVRRDQVIASERAHPRDRLDVRVVRRPGAGRGHLPAARLARRPRRSRARRQRPRACAGDVRRARVRPQDRPGDVLRSMTLTYDETSRTAKAGDLTLHYHEAGPSALEAVETEASAAGCPW